MKLINFFIPQQFLDSNELKQKSEILVVINISVLLATLFFAFFYYYVGNNIAFYITGLMPLICFGNLFSFKKFENFNL
ncbi:MAG: hypothetical protein ACK4IX_08305, partial [Candidatus Sericytochromatia bacterium]